MSAVILSHDEVNSYAIPISVNFGPPTISRTSWIIGVETVIETKIDNRPHDGVSLGGSPSFIHPIVSDGKCRSEFSEIEEMLSIPVIRSSTERLSSTISRSDL
jgi:hypothetical protein